MPKDVKKTEQSIYECLCGFRRITFSAPPQISWLHRQFSSAQFRNEEMMGDGFLGATAGLFEQ